MALIQPGRTVRPWLRRVAIAASIVLTPIAIWTAWDYVEARRLAAVVRAVKARGEPVTTRPQTAANVSSPDNAARYYDAAGALLDSTGLYGATGLLNRLDRSAGDERSLAADIKKFLDGNRQAEELLSTATDLEFFGFRPGFEYNYRRAQFYQLGRLADLRTVERAMAHDAQAAARAIVEQVRLVRVLGGSERSYGADLGGFAADAARRACVQLPRVLSIGPSTAALERLQRSLQDVDIDSAIEQQILSERALLLQTYWNEPNGWYTAPGYGFGNPTGPFFYLLRPWIAHRVVRQAELLEEFLNTARRPWPEKLQLEAPTESEIAARRSRPWTILPGPSDWSIGNPDISRFLNARRTEVAASTLALVRSALAATAVARFRLANAGELPRTLEDLVPEFLPAVPVDPYSGKPLRYVQDAARFAIYSDGTNQRDDGGKGLNATAGRRWGVYSVTPAPLDIGVEVSTGQGAAVARVPPSSSAPGRH